MVPPGEAQIMVRIVAAFELDFYAVLDVCTENVIEILSYSVDILESVDGLRIALLEDVATVARKHR